MPKLSMTAVAVSATKARIGERIDYFDAHPRHRQRGLVLRVSGKSDKNGALNVTRTWAVLCRVKGNARLRRFTIGDYPTFGLGEARERAADIIRHAKRGADPLRERREAERQARFAGRDTVGTLVEQFMDDLARRPKRKGGRRSPRYVEETQRNFDNHVLPRWVTQNIRDITRRDVSDLVRTIALHGSDVRKNGVKRHVAGGGIAANRTLAAVRSFFNWAVRNGVLDASPATMVDPPGEETPRERTLTDDEIRVFWPQAKVLGYPFGHFFMLALVTGQRRDEIAKMVWSEIDDIKRIWIIPKEKTKNRREHILPLSELALSIIMDAREAATAIQRARAEILGLSDIPPLPGYVLSTRANAPISGYSKAKALLDAQMQAAVNDGEGEMREHWTTHDLRRTCATGMANLGVEPHVVDCVLNHVSGFRSGVSGVYNRATYLSQMERALERWGEYLLNELILGSRSIEELPKITRQTA